MRDYETAACPLKLFLQILEKLERIAGIARLGENPCEAPMAFAQTHRVFPALHELLKAFQQVLVTVGNRKACSQGQ